MTRSQPTRPRSMASIAAAVAAAAAGVLALVVARSELPQLRRYLRIKQM